MKTSKTKTRCRCGVTLSAVPDSQTPPEFCSLKCKRESKAGELILALSEMHRLASIRWVSTDMAAQESIKRAGALLNEL